MSGETSERNLALAAVLLRYPHDDPSQLPEPDAELARYAVVSSYRDSLGGVAYWLALTDDAAGLLEQAHADYYETGFLPFLVVDLDSMLSYDVDVSFALGAVTQDSKAVIPDPTR